MTTTLDQIERLAEYADEAASHLDNLDHEIAAIKANPLIVTCHFNLLHAQETAHLARLMAERAATLLRDIVAPEAEIESTPSERYVEKIKVLCVDDRSGNAITLASADWPRVGLLTPEA